MTELSFVTAVTSRRCEAKQRPRLPETEYQNCRVPREPLCPVELLEGTNFWERDHFVFSLSVKSFCSRTRTREPKCVHTLRDSGIFCPDEIAGRIRGIGFGGTAVVERFAVVASMSRDLTESHHPRTQRVLLRLIQGECPYARQYNENLLFPPEISNHPSEKIIASFKPPMQQVFYLTATGNFPHASRDQPCKPSGNLLQGPVKGFGLKAVGNFLLVLKEINLQGFGNFLHASRHCLKASRSLPRTPQVTA